MKPHNFNMRPPSSQDMIADWGQRLRNSLSQILSDAGSLQPPEKHTMEASEFTSAQSDDLKSYAATMALTISKVFVAARLQACRDLRFFRIDRGLNHVANCPDVLMTILFISALFTLEGTMMGVMLATGGHVNPVPAFTIGIVMAAVNVSVALSAGYFCTRYLNFRTRSKYPDAHDPTIRKLARFGLFAHYSLLGLLIFSTMRIRATGSHEGIFHFGEVGAFETFDNAITLAILAISLLTTLFATYKGRHGFSDVEVGYTHVQRRAEELVDDDVQDFIDEAKAELEGRCEDALDSLEERISGYKNAINSFNAGVQDLERRRIEHNNHVHSAKDEARLYVQEQAEIDGHGGQSCNIEALDSLLISSYAIPSRLAVPEGPEQRELESRITATRNEAMAELTAAHTHYLTSKPVFEFPATAANAPNHRESHIGGQSHV